jgi:hypothetical protein
MRTLKIYLINNYHTQALVDDINSLDVSKNDTLFFSMGTLVSYIKDNSALKRFNWYYSWRSAFNKKGWAFNFFDSFYSCYLFLKLRKITNDYDEVEMYTPNFNHILSNLLLNVDNLTKVNLVAEGTLNFRKRREGKFNQLVKILISFLFLQQYKLLSDPLELPNKSKFKTINNLYLRKTIGVCTSVPSENLMVIKEKNKPFNLLKKNSALIICQHFLYEVDEKLKDKLLNILKDFIEMESIDLIYFKPHPTSGIDNEPIENRLILKDHSEIYKIQEPAEDTIQNLGTEYVITIGYSTVIENIIDYGWDQEGLKPVVIGLNTLNSLGVVWAQDFLTRAEQINVNLIN